MELNYQIFLMLFLFIGFSFFGIILNRKKPFGKSLRTDFIWKYCLLCGMVFSATLVPLVIILPQSILTIVSWLLYSFLICYSVIVELPSWKKISKYDENASKALEKLRAELIKMRFISIDQSILELKNICSQNSQYLKDETIDIILNDFIAVCERIHNRDVNLWDLTLSEVTKTIDSVKQRSKHPFPKLIDILALSGLSVLIAQFLKILG